MTELADQGLSYSTIKSTKSAISHINMNNNIFKDHTNLIKQFMKGVYKERPSIPKYFSTWDPQKILNYIKSWIDDGSLKQLTFKTAFLVLLCSAKRGQEIINIHIDNIHITEDEIIIRSGDLSKTSKPDTKDPLIIFPKFRQDTRICIYSLLKEYLERTEILRNEEKQLFISFAKPYKKISRDTLSRWIKLMMNKGGVDTEIYKTHSLRHAATSCAASKDVSLAVILSRVGWKQESTFTKFYKRKVMEDRGVFCSSILQ